MFRHLRSCCIALLAVLSIARPAAAQDYDRWYTVSMGGQRAGWMHARQETREDLITTGGEMTLSIKRDAIEISISIASEFIETADGKPVSMRLERRLGNATVIQDYTFKPDAIELLSREGDVETRARLALPTGTWLTPAAASLYGQQRLKAGADKIVIRTIDAMSGPEIITSTRSEFSKATLDVLGQSMPVTRSSVVSSASPGVKMIEFLDDQGVPVRSETSFGGLALTVEAAEKSTALARGDAPELMLDTFIRPDRAIKAPRGLSKAAYTLSIRSNAMPALPDTGTQTVKVLDAARTSVTVAAREPRPAPAEDLDNPAFLASSSAINIADDRVKALRDRAVRSAPPEPPARAEAIRRFVHGYIKTKDLTVAFGTASEVARTAEGDCTEHAVLLAALLRADGIPSRVVSGLIYADQFAGQRGIFGYHMWSQALLEVDGQQRWIDLDATLPDTTPFDATHIALAVSALADTETQSTLLSIAPLLGNLDITVDSCE
ncbi:MAG: lasso peptide biosynthesis protein [Phycisphaerales bacterium]|nr:lasso peptide biosynthesis protein [Phycisphaerales bacterium]